MLELPFSQIPWLAEPVVVNVELEISPILPPLSIEIARAPSLVVKIVTLSISSIKLEEFP